MSSELLQALNAQGGELTAVSCGICADEYLRIIDAEGQRKMGSPYLVCFKSLVARVAKAMDERGFPGSDRFSVLIDKDPGYLDAIGWFNQVQREPRFKYANRLGTCTAANMDVFTVLQPADMIAYEVFKWLLHARQINGGKIPPHREPLKRLAAKNFVSEGYFGRKQFLRLKTDIESARAADGGAVVDGGLTIIPEN